ELPRLPQAAALPRRGSSPRTSVWRHRRKDGTTLQAELTSQDLELDGRRACCVFVKDQTEQIRGEAEMAERLAVSALGAAVSTSLTWGGTLHRKLQDGAQALVHHLNLEMAGVWQRSESEATLDLRGGAVREGTLAASPTRAPPRAHWLGEVSEARVPQWLHPGADTAPARAGWALGGRLRDLGA